MNSFFRCIAKEHSLRGEQFRGLCEFIKVALQENEFLREMNKTSNIRLSDFHRALLIN